MFLSGIILPQVNTAEEASEVVKYSKFPPQGLRGQGSPFAGFAHNVDIATYVKTANETTIVCVQIESRQGVDNVDAICAVPGVGKLPTNSPTMCSELTPVKIWPLSAPMI
jgi:4-hydroxy-2-oxoheptanedioate aldolase